MALTISDAQVSSVVNAWWAAPGIPTLDRLRALIAAAWPSAGTKFIGAAIIVSAVSVDLEETITAITTNRTLTWTTASASPARSDGLTVSQVYAQGGSARAGDAVSLGWAATRFWLSVPI